MGGVYIEEQILLSPSKFCEQNGKTEDCRIMTVQSFITTYINNKAQKFEFFHETCCIR